MRLARRGTLSPSAFGRFAVMSSVHDLRSEEHVALFGSHFPAHDFEKYFFNGSQFLIISGNDFGKFWLSLSPNPGFPTMIVSRHSRASFPSHHHQGLSLHMTAPPWFSARADGIAPEGTWSSVHLPAGTDRDNYAQYQVISVLHADPMSGMVAGPSGAKRHEQ